MEPGRGSQGPSALQPCLCRLAQGSAPRPPRPPRPCPASRHRQNQGRESSPCRPSLLLTIEKRAGKRARQPEELGMKPSRAGPRPLRPSPAGGQLLPPSLGSRLCLMGEALPLPCPLFSSTALGGGAARSARVGVRRLLWGTRRRPPLPSWKRVVLWTFLSGSLTGSRWVSSKGGSFSRLAPKPLPVPP